MRQTQALVYMKTQVRPDISLEEIKQREASEKRKLIADRIRAVRLAAEGEYQYAEIARICGRSSRLFTTKWIKRFNQAGFEGLETQEGQGAPRILEKEEQEILVEWMNDPEAHGYNTWTAPRLMKKIKEEFNKEPSEQCIYDYLSRLGFKHRKARPTPSKADKQELEAFKK